MTYDVVFHTTGDYPLQVVRVKARTPKAAAHKADKMDRLMFCTGYKLVKDGRLLGVRTFKI